MTAVLQAIFYMQFYKREVLILIKSEITSWGFHEQYIGNEWVAKQYLNQW